MKALIVYYSMSENTDFVAKEIAKKLDAELLRLEPEKQYPDSGFKKYFWGGKSAVMGEKPKLKPYSFASDKYDTVIFGTPIWASNIAPPLRTFICENKGKLSRKTFALFMCSSGGGTRKAADKLKNLLQTETFAAEMSLIDPKTKFNDSVPKSLDDFCDALKDISL